MGMGIQVCQKIGMGIQVCQNGNGNSSMPKMGMGMERVHATVGMGIATFSCVPKFQSVDSMRIIQTDSYATQIRKYIPRRFVGGQQCMFTIDVRLGVTYKSIPHVGVQYFVVFILQKNATTLQ